MTAVNARNTRLAIAEGLLVLLLGGNLACDIAHQSRRFEEGTPNHILLLQKLNAERTQIALTSARYGFARSQDSKHLDEGISILRDRAAELRQAIRDVTLNRGDWSSEDRAKVLAPMLKELEWAESSIGVFEIPLPEICAPREPDSQVVTTHRSKTIEEEKDAIGVATTGTTNETSEPPVTPERNGERRIILTFDPVQIETEIGPLVFKNITVGRYESSYGEFKTVRGSIVNKTEVFWSNIVLGLTFKRGPHKSEQIEVEPSFLWPESETTFVLPSLFPHRIPEDATDLPPGTSPLSKLDLGPFEVHSMV